MTTFTPHPVEPRSQLRDLAAEEIRRLIISGEAATDAHLRLHELAEHIGVSITPVREALLVLAQEGWVLQVPHRGFRVTRLQRQDIVDLMDLQTYLYERLARRAAARITSDMVRDLRAIDLRITTAAPSDARAIEQHNHELHARVNVIADSPRLSWFTQASLVLPGGFGWAAVPGWLEHTRAGHAALIDALEGGDVERAGAAMRQQSTKARELFVEHLESAGLFAGGDSRSTGGSLPDSAASNSTRSRLPGPEDQLRRAG